MGRRKRERERREGGRERVTTGGVEERREQQGEERGRDGERQALTVSDEVFGHVQRDFDGERAGDLRAVHHGQDARADGDQSQRGLVQRAVGATCRGRWETGNVRVSQEE